MMKEKRLDLNSSSSQYVLVFKLLYQTMPPTFFMLKGATHNFCHGRKGGTPARLVALSAPRGQTLSGTVRPCIYSLLIHTPIHPCILSLEGPGPMNSFSE